MRRSRRPAVTRLVKVVLHPEDVSSSSCSCSCSCSPCRALGVPVTDHTYEDCRLMISAGELTLPMEAGLVEFTKISRKLK